MADLLPLVEGGVYRTRNGRKVKIDSASNKPAKGFFLDRPKPRNPFSRISWDKDTGKVYYRREAWDLVERVDAEGD